MRPLPWLTVNPELPAGEQTAELARIIDGLTDQHPGMEILVLIDGRWDDPKAQSVEVELYLDRVAAGWPERPETVVEPGDGMPRAGRGWRGKANGARVIVKAGLAPNGIGVRGVHPVAVFVDGFAPSERLLREIPEIIRREIPCPVRYVRANQPVEDLQVHIEADKMGYLACTVDRNGVRVFDGVGRSALMPARRTTLDSDDEVTTADWLADPDPASRELHKMEGVQAATLTASDGRILIDDVRGLEVFWMGTSGKADRADRAGRFAAWRKRALARLHWMVTR